MKGPHTKGLVNLSVNYGLLLISQSNVSGLPKQNLLTQVIKMQMSDKVPGGRNSRTRAHRVSTFCTCGLWKAAGASTVKTTYLVTRRPEVGNTVAQVGEAWRQLPQSGKTWATVLRNASRLTCLTLLICLFACLF